MGNKLKYDKEQKIVNSFSKYILCPECWKKIPNLFIFIENDIPKIKINCSCFPEKNIFIILNLEDYINTINNKEYDIYNCINHKDIKGNFFCLNCENWLCEICKKEHFSKNNNECENKMSEENGVLSFCNEHISEKNKFYCKSCKSLLCKLCFLNHNIKKEIGHKGVNISNYLTEEKIINKYNKNNIYTKEIIPYNLEIKNKIINKINIVDSKGDDKELSEFRQNIEESYIKNKNINELIKSFIEILLKQIEFFKEKPILNKKFIINIINNTSYNLYMPKYNNTLIFDDEISNILVYFNTNYISMKLKAKIKRNNNYLNKKEEENASVELLCLLKDNKIASVDSDFIINIWDIQTRQNIFTFNEHTNKITSIIPLNNNCLGSASNDNTIKIWDYKKGECIKTIRMKTNPYIIYSIYGKNDLIGCLPYRNSINIYDYSQENKIIFEKNIEKIIPWIEGFYSFPNDERIILSYTGFFSVFSAEIEEIKRIAINNETPEVFLQISNGDLIVGMLGHQIFIYDKNLFFKKRLFGHNNTIIGLIQLEENIILSYSVDSIIKLWDLKDNEVIETFINIEKKINHLINLGNKQLICSIDEKNYNIEKWDIEIYQKEIEI